LGKFTLVFLSQFVYRDGQNLDLMRTPPLADAQPLMTPWQIAILFIPQIIE